MERGPFSIPGADQRRPAVSRPRRPRPRLAVHPGHARRRGGAVRRPGGRPRRGTTLTYAELAEAARDFAAALVAAGVEPGDRVADLVLQLRRVGGGRARHLRGRRGAGSGEHEVQGRGGGRHPVPERGPGPRHRHRLPGHRLRGHARGRRAPPSRRSRRSSSPRAAPSRRAVPWRDFLAGATPAAVAEVQRRRAALGPGRPFRHPLHLGDDGRPQGRRDDARPHADRGHRLGRHDRPAAPATSTSR